MEHIEEVGRAGAAVYHRSELPYETVERAAVMAAELDQHGDELEHTIENIARFLADTDDA
jgi:ABC-type transporter Mla subunit MlaD